MCAVTLLPCVADYCMYVVLYTCEVERFVLTVLNEYYYYYYYYYYIHGPKLMKLNFCRFTRVTNDGPYTLL